MYDWLTAALANAGTVVTANRRLARILRGAYGEQQLRAGKQAWQSPDIDAWQDWLGSIVHAAEQQQSLPTRINQHQSQWLWERCLRKEIGASASGLVNLVRLSRDTWQRLADWQISISEVARSAQSTDQRMFASAAGRYLAMLDREHWVDDAGLAALVLELIDTRRTAAAAQITFAGFDRQRPITTAIAEALQNTGSEVSHCPATALSDSGMLQQFEHSDAELRAAGAWAREQAENQTGAQLAIIVSDLQQNADRVCRLVREGATPGWQYAGPAFSDAVNVSYGRKLAEYPAITIALLLLRWLVGEISATDVGQLLRSPLLGKLPAGGRIRLELRLRRLPDRNWSPAMVGAALRGRDEVADGSDWMSRLAAFGERCRESGQLMSPANWAVFFDQILQDFGWPGQRPLNSAEFQLINRWRELLNDLARLELVAPAMSLNLAVSRLELLAGETLFQPESGTALVQLMGPLEASGAEFDAIWVSGLTARNWPPAGTPSILLSRHLQQQHGMPDADPADTRCYATQVLSRLTGSAPTVVCSYSMTDDATEQTASDLLAALSLQPAAARQDPGWHAASLVSRGTSIIATDTVPPVTAEEKISGGAGTVQRQINDPISAFVLGRMGVSLMQPQAIGVPAALRGNLIHDALYKLYIDTPSSREIHSWQGDGLTQRIEVALDFAFRRHERNTDKVLHALFFLERGRVAKLLRQFVALDRERGDFAVEAVEGQFDFVAGEIRLRLRFDRIDKYADGSIAILDYKTGTKKRLLGSDGMPDEMQLFVYACAADMPVAALALVNIDSRETTFDGAGRGYGDAELWPELLASSKEQIGSACAELCAGDVRINMPQGLKKARPLNLLSRYAELRRED